MSDYDELVKRLRAIEFNATCEAMVGPSDRRDALLEAANSVNEGIAAIQSLQARVKELEADAGRWRKFIESKKFERNIPEWCKD